jgi:hypothetical protein
MKCSFCGDEICGWYEWPRGIKPCYKCDINIKRMMREESEFNRTHSMCTTG